MKLDDATLFDFDKKRLDHWKESNPKAALRDHPELYRNHLVIARLLKDWHDDIGSHAIDLRPEYHKGLKWALKEVAAHLRQGWLPAVGDPLQRRGCEAFRRSEFRVAHPRAVAERSHPPRPRGR
jgi:hypothetical protein